jgi:hypothetical protein
MTALLGRMRSSRLRSRMRSREPRGGRLIGHCEPLPGQHQLADRHLVEGRRPGLVGADLGRAAQRLDRCQPLDQRAPLREPGGAHREGERDDGGQALRDRCDRQRHRTDEQRPELLPAQQPQPGHDRTTAAAMTASVRLRPDLRLQPCRARLGGVQQVRDPAGLGLHARRGDQRCLRVDVRGRGLGDRLSLPGQHRLGHLQRDGGQDPTVRGHPGTRVEHHDVAHHELSGIHGQHGAVPADRRGRHQHLLQRGE